MKGAAITDDECEGEEHSHSKSAADQGQLSDYAEAQSSITSNVLEAKSLFSMNAQVKNRACHILTSRSSISSLVKQKVTGQKFEFKVRADQSAKLITELKKALTTVGEEQDTFVEEVAGIEANILSAYAASVSEFETSRSNSLVAHQEKEIAVNELSLEREKTVSLTSLAADATTKLEAAHKDLCEETKKAATNKAELEEEKEKMAGLQRLYDELDLSNSQSCKAHEEQVKVLTTDLNKYTAQVEEQAKEVCELTASHDLAAGQLKSAQVKLSCSF